MILSIIKMDLYFIYLSLLIVELFLNMHQEISCLLLEFYVKKPSHGLSNFEVKQKSDANLSLIFGVQVKIGTHNFLLHSVARSILNSGRLTKPSAFSSCDEKKQN